MRGYSDVNWGGDLNEIVFQRIISGALSQVSVFNFVVFCGHHMLNSQLYYTIFKSFFQCVLLHRLYSAYYVVLYIRTAMLKQCWPLVSTAICHPPPEFDSRGTNSALCMNLCGRLVFLSFYLNFHISSLVHCSLIDILRQTFSELGPQTEKKKKRRENVRTIIMMFEVRAPIHRLKRIIISIITSRLSFKLWPPPIGYL